jgi:branched-chain amino acid transport system substrate-binding protein
MIKSLRNTLLSGWMMIGLALSASVSAEELRIGFLAPMTGGGAQIGKDLVDGLQLYLDQHANKLGGADVKLIVEDEQGNPGMAVSKAKKLILNDNVQIVMGGWLASEAYALAPLSTAQKTLYIASPAGDDLTQRELAKYPYFIRTTWTSSQPTQPLAQWACDQGYKKVATVAADYAFGYESVGGFQRVFEDCGGQVIQKIWPPLGTKDFGPYISTIKGSADAVFTLMVGPMALQFPKQLRGAGIKKPILGGTTSYDEFALPFMGDEVIGDVSALHYSAALETPKNEAFVKAYRAKYGKVPSYYSENSYTTGQWIDETIKQAGGKYPGPEKFIAIMQAIKLDSVRGPVAMEDMRNPIENIYIKKVEKKKMFGYDKDELWNTVIKTYPNVSQFWNYRKEDILKQPVYSRDFPPCKYCD